MRYLILDTETLHDDPRLRRTSARALLDYLRVDQSLTLLIPEVVLRELEGQYSRELPERINAFKKAQRDLNAFLDKEMPSGLSDIESERALSGYRAWLRERLTVDYRAQILPIPEIAHAILVDRAIARRKPFAEKGRGYRDTLIWYSVMAACAIKEAERLYFVTGNTSDFADSSGNELHSDLKRDLQDHAIDDSKILYFKSVSLFLEHEGKLKTSLADVIRGDQALHVALLRSHELEILDQVDWRISESPEDFEYSLLTPLPSPLIDEAKATAPSETHVLLTLCVTYPAALVRRWHSQFSGGLFTKHKANLHAVINFLLSKEDRVAESTELEDFWIEFLPPRRSRRADAP